MSEAIEKRLEISYYMNPEHGAPAIPEGQVGDLEAKAMERITSMMTECYIAGELCETYEDENGNEHTARGHWDARELAVPAPPHNHSEFDSVVRTHAKAVLAVLQQDEDFDPEDADYRQEVEEEDAPCDVLALRPYLPENLLHSADAAIFSEALVKSPTTDLMWAARAAGLDAYRDHLADMLGRLTKA